MAGASTFNRSGSSGRTALPCNDTKKKLIEIIGMDSERSKGETSLQRDMESLNVSQRPARPVSDKPEKKNVHGGYNSGEGVNSRPGPSRCLSFYVKGGGCRVGACEEFDEDGEKRSGTMEECLPHRVMIMGVEKAEVECFSHGVTERFWKRNLRKGKAIEQCPPSSAAGISLPDDVLELILFRLPFASLMTARCVCKKWRNLTTTPHFMQMRCEGGRKSPWLFLFGIRRDGRHSGEVHCLDVASDRWHRISNDMLKGRFMFSVANVGTDVYVVGGCSGLSGSSLSMERSSFKTHKGVLVFNPLTGLWRKAASMRSARSRPVLGVFEVSAGCGILRTRTDHHDRLPPRSRIGGVSEVYEDPHRFSVRRSLRVALCEEDDSWEAKRKPSKINRRGMNEQPKFALIAVGGHGPWDEHLDSGEIYDPLADRWVEIARLPGGFGFVCSGAVCGGMFYVYSEADRLAGYDLEKGFWISVQISHPPPRLREYYPKLVSCGNRLFMFCVSWCEGDGQLNGGERAVRKMWELDFPSHRWDEVSRHPDAPMDWNAVFIAHESMIYGVEMFRIFGQVLNFLIACHVSDTELKWKRVSRKLAAHEADASSCTTKSMVVLHL